MPTTLSDFNLNTLKLRAEYGLDINDDGMAEDYINNLEYVNVLEYADDISGAKEMRLDAELFVTAPTPRFAKNGIKTYASVKTSTDNWVTDWEEAIFTGSTARNNTLPNNDVKIVATTFNNDYLDKKPTRQLFTSQDIATIMETLLIGAGVDAGDIDLPLTGKVLPFYIVSDNWPIRYYIEDLARGALQIVGFNREGVFSSNSIAKNNFDGGSLTPEVTLTLADVIKFESRQIRSNMYYNDIRVRSWEFDLLTDEQFYFNTELVGYEIKPNGRLFFTLDFDEYLPLTINSMVARNSNLNLLITWGYRVNSYFDFFTADDGGIVNNTNITVESMSIIPSDTEGRDRLLVIFQNSSGSTSYFLKQILLNGTVLQRRPPYEVENTDETAIIEDGRRIPLIYQSNAIQGYTATNTLLALLSLNLMNYANVYRFEIQGRPQLEVGSIIQFQDRSGVDLLGVVFEIDSELSKDRGYSQLLTVKTIEVSGDYLQLDNASDSLDGTKSLL